MKPENRTRIRLVRCTEHGKLSRAVVVCPHLKETNSTAKVAYFEWPESDRDIGQMLCGPCRHGTGTLDIENAAVVCMECAQNIIHRNGLEIPPTGAPA